MAWETALEVDVLGFHVYRAKATGGPETCLTPALLLATGGPAYTYVVDEEPCEDSEPSQGCTRIYWLELVDTGGGTARYGPAPATLPPAAPQHIYPPVVLRQCP
ncbi:MAG: hypothetical protein KKB13_01680 [Chloroflexi bacterium]|nr:hypothetical protein [Chloroflexota bacterium]